MDRCPKQGSLGQVLTRSEEKRCGCPSHPPKRAVPVVSALTEVALAIVRGPHRPDLLREEMLPDLFEATAARIPEAEAGVRSSAQSKRSPLQATASTVATAGRRRREVTSSSAMALIQ